jgi:hypothetical protein
MNPSDYLASDCVTPESLAKDTPLVEQLLSVPRDAALNIDTPNPLGFDTRHIPIGRLCEKAAAALIVNGVDAARYRWLRNPDNANGPNLVASFGPEQLDAAIDAAMASDSPSSGA